MRGVSDHSASGNEPSSTIQAPGRNSWGQTKLAGRGDRDLLHLTQSHTNAVSVWDITVSVCGGEGMCPITITGTTSKTEWGPLEKLLPKGSRRVCGNQWDDGSGLSCASQLESSPLISGPETLANQFRQANTYYVGWQNLSVQMSYRTHCCFKLWMAALLCQPHPVQAFCGSWENPDCVSESITLVIVQDKGWFLCTLYDPHALKHFLFFVSFSYVEFGVILL